MVKQYTINNKVIPKQLENTGFKQVKTTKRDDIYRLHTPLYEMTISLDILVELSPPDCDTPCYNIDIVDDYIGSTYASAYSEYGKNEVRDAVIKEYEKKMKKLVEKGIFEEVVD